MSGKLGMLRGFASRMNLLRGRNPWNHLSLSDLGAAALLVVAGVLLRLTFRDLPNFAPVAALALFAGYLLRSWKLALCVPVSVMVLSDLFIGGYDWRMMLVVYTMLAVPVLWRTGLRRVLQPQPGKLTASLASATVLCGFGLASSLAFYLVTNFACWLSMGIYEPTASGLLRCYVQALPFFRYTLLGDLFFAVVLFGGYAACVYWGAAKGWTTRRRLEASCG